MPHLFIFLFISLFLVQNHFFIRQDNYPPFSDAPGHLLKASWTFSNFKLGLDRVMWPDSYPPLTYWNTCIYYALMGLSVEASQYSMFVFIIIFLLSLYGIGYEYGGHFSGAAVMALGASSPQIINYSRLYLLDFPQAAMTSLTFYILLKTKGYGSRFFSILLGLIFCLGFFTKWSIAFFMILPLLWFVLPHVIRSMNAFLLAVSFALLVFIYFFMLKYYIHLSNIYHYLDALKIFLIIFFIPGSIYLFAVTWWRRLYEKEWDQKIIESVNGVLNAIHAGLIALIVPTLWLIWSSKIILEKIQMDKQIFGFPAARFLEYLKVILISCNYFPLLFLLGIVLIFVLRNRENFKPNLSGCFNRLILPVNLIFTYILMSYMGPFDVRYILSFFIFTAAIGGWWAGWIGKARLPATVTLVTLSLLSFTGWLFIPESSGLLQVIRPVPFRDGIQNPLFSLKPLTALYPFREKYDLDQLFAKIEQPEVRSSDEPQIIPWIAEVGDEVITCDYMNFLVLSKSFNVRFEHIRKPDANRELIKKSAAVIIICRNIEFADKNIERLKAVYGHKELEIIKEDLMDGVSLYLLREKRKNQGQLSVFSNTALSRDSVFQHFADIIILNK